MEQLTGLCGQAVICERWGISRTSYKRLQKRPDWPKPIHIGHRVLYRVSELEEWLEHQVAAQLQE